MPLTLVLVPCDLPRLGGAAVVGALLYVSGIPRVQQDILQVGFSVS